MERKLILFRESQEAQFEMYERITQEREAHLAEGGEPECLTDFYLQQVQERGSQPGSFTRRQLYFFQGDMFGAGTETSVNTILFALMILSSHRYRDLQEDIRQEILTELGSAPPSLSHCLPLLRATILEVQRLRPVTPQGIPHGVLSPVLAGDWVLPPGTMVMPLHWAVNRDPAIWSLPDTFHPQRFLQEDGLRGNILPFQVPLYWRSLEINLLRNEGWKEKMSGRRPGSVLDIPHLGQHLPEVLRQSGARDRRLGRPGQWLHVISQALQSHPGLETLKI